MTVDWREYNQESRAERAARHRQARALVRGKRGQDGLTDGERKVLDALRRAGYELTAAAEFPRLIRKGAA